MDKKTLSNEDASFIQSICTRSFERESELANDCFLYIWEKLHEDGSRRINAFRGDSSFRTFLYSVASKLVIDFRRSRFGYRVLPKYFAEFDEINRRVFKLFIYHRLASGWIENSILAEFRLSRAEAQRRVEEVENRIRESRVRFDNPRNTEPIFLQESSDTAFVDGNATPEQRILNAELERKRDKVADAVNQKLDTLDPQDVLMLRLYFEQGMSAKEISAALPGVRDKTVYKRVELTLRRLRKHLIDCGITDEDIREIFESI
ncbi:MAG: RNA polymerase sigma factor [Deltaproteobacteria bacterium]